VNGPGVNHGPVKVARSRVFALAVLAAVGLAARAAPAAADPAAVDACALLTAEEVSAAMGQTVEAGQFADNGVTRDGAVSTTCLWQVALPAGAAPDPTKSLGGRSFAILNIQNWPGGPGDAAKFLEGFSAAFADHTIASQPVPVEVGADAAIWWGDGVAGRVKGVSFGMSVAIAGDRAARRPKAESLARLVAARLAKRRG
jgi:hypothetical protein